MATTNLGKVSVTPKGTWSDDVAYEVLDIVLHGGSSYIAIQDVPVGTATSNTTYWMQIASKGDKGNTGEIQSASASISGTYGTPAVSVTAGGTTTDRTFAFAFSNLVGNGIASLSMEETATVGNVHTYTLTATLSSGDVETLTFDVEDGAVTSVNGRTGAVTGLAEDDGYYEDMSVGSADQLISTVYVEDEVPYNFRTSGGTADIGDREFDEIHGGTIAWNQQISNGDFASTSGWYCTKGTVSASSNVLTFSFNDTPTSYYSNRVYSQSYNILAGHRYLLFATVKSPKSANMSVYNISSTVLHQYTSVTADTWTTITDISIPSNSISTTFNIALGTDYSVFSSSDSFQVKNCMCFDLTQMFGSTIAEHIYNLESGNTGAGVAWFKSLFPKPYYAYNTGTLLSVTGLSKHKMVAFNAWDEEWEKGILNSDGTVSSNNDRIITKNYVPVNPNTTYCLSIPYNSRGRAAFYDASYNLIQYYGDFPTGTISSAGSRYYATFATPSNAKYMKYNMVTAYGTTYHNDICINISWDGERDGEYEEYKAYEYALDSSLTLRGIPKLDINNKLYYDGDIYASDGTVTRRFAAVDMGTLSWNYQSDNTRFGTTITGIKRSASTTSVPNIISSRYAATNYAATTGSVPPNMTVAVHNNYDNVYVVDTAYTDKNAFTSAVSGVYLVYELATPTTESADSFTYTQTVDDFGTEEYVIAEQSGVAMPVGHFTKYTNNLRAKLEMAPESPSGNGDYIVRQADGENTYVPLVIPTELPTNPSEDGTYILKATVSSGVTTLSWESAT